MAKGGGQQAGTSTSAASSYHVLDIFALPDGTAKLDVAERRKIITKMTRSAGPEGFKENANAHASPISLAEEATVCFVFFWVMGGPFIALFLALYAAAFWPLTHTLGLLAFFALMAFHPLPNCTRALAESWFAQATYKYFSYRFVWADDVTDQIEALPVFIGAGAPHGVMPFSNILSISAINTFAFHSLPPPEGEGKAGVEGKYEGRDFKGAAASAVFRTPGLRYFTLAGCIDVSAREVTKAVSKGLSVGIVVDGIAGIFRSNRGDEEVVAIRHRKGLAKLALRTGTPLVAAYSVGNTEVFTAGFDPWGGMEWLSRKLQASLFFLWGRWYLPIPMRRNVALLFGKPIPVKKMAPEDITQADVDEVHEKLLASMREIFDQHKSHLGIGHKKLVFE